MPRPIKTAIFLCDVSGVMAEPWREAGYECWLIDIQHPRGKDKRDGMITVGADIHELYRGHWWLPERADFAFAFPDCTYLTNSGNGWQKRRGPGCVGRGLLFADACWRLLISYDCPWGMENPAVGRLSSWRKPDYTFHPWEYAGYLDDPEAENTTKNTGIWSGGGFVMPEKRPVEGPHRHDCHECPPGAERSNIRSRTPAGFAKGVFEANCQSELIQESR